MVNLFLYLKYEISLRGFYTEKVIVWVWLATSLILVIKWRQLPNFLQGYAILVLIVVILTMLPMMVPFAELLRFTFGNTAHAYIDERTRVQSSPGGLVSPTLQVVEEGWITEKIITSQVPFQDGDSLHIITNNDTLLELEVFSPYAEDTIMRARIKR